jgi:protein TonB
MDTGVKAFIISMTLHASIGCGWFALLGSMADLSEAVVIDLSLQDYSCTHGTTVSQQVITQEIQQKRCSSIPKQHEIPSRQPTEPSYRQAETEHTATQDQASPVTASTPDIQKQLVAYAPSTASQEHQYSQPHSAPVSASVANERTVSVKADVGISDTTHEQLQQHYSKEHFAYIRKHINDNIRYPRAARIRGQEGTAMVAFTIKKDGTISHPQIVSSSGHKLLDEQAISAILDTAPFPRPPVAAQMRVPVVYQLANP